MKVHELLNEAALDVGLDIAATLLKASKDDLERVDDADLVDRVLDTGKEVAHKDVQMARGRVLVRVFKALGQLFARVESSQGNYLYRAVVQEN